MRFSPLSCLTLSLVAGLTACVIALPVTNFESVHHPPHLYSIVRLHSVLYHRLHHGDSPAERGGSHLIRRAHLEDLSSLLNLYKDGGCRSDSDNLRRAGWQFVHTTDKWVKKAPGDLTLAEIGQSEFTLAYRKKFRDGYLKELVHLWRTGGGQAATQAGWQPRNSQLPYYWAKMGQGAPQFELAKIPQEEFAAAAKQSPR